MIPGHLHLLRLGGRGLATCGFAEGVEGSHPRAEGLFPGALRWLQPCGEGRFVGLARGREVMCLLARGFSCPALFTRGLFSPLGEPCPCPGPVVQVQPRGRQEAPILYKHTAGESMVQCVELAFPRDQVCPGLEGSLLNR